MGRYRFSYWFIWGVSLTIVAGLVVPVGVWLLSRPEFLGIPGVVGMLGVRERRHEPAASKSPDQVFVEIFLLVAIVVGMSVIPAVLYLIAQPQVLSARWIGGLILLISLVGASFGYYYLRRRFENPADTVGFFLGVAAGPFGLYQAFLWVLGKS